MTGFAVIVLPDRAWLFPAGAAILVLAVALVWAGRRSAAESRVRVGCALLKLAGIVALALCLLEPLWVSQRAKPGANIFALLADNSQSLQVKDEAATRSRGENLREKLIGPENWQRALAENFQLRRYTFDTRLQSTRNFGELNFSGRASALDGALRAASEQWRGQPVAGVLLFTDGNATDHGTDSPAFDGCPPVYPVVVGESAGLRDISVERAGVSQTAFEDAPVTVLAWVGVQGFAGADIEARLTQVATVAAGTNANPGGVNALHVSGTSNVVARLDRRAAGAAADLDFRFQIQPDKPGLHFYELAAGVRGELEQPDHPSREATTFNNRRLVAVDRGQEPLRVLCVSGRPNWEFKFLNRAIQEDPQVRMVSLIRVARREPKFEFKGRPGESSNPLFRGFGKQDEETARYDQPVLVRLNTKDEFELRGGFPKTAGELFAYQAVILDHVEAEFFTQDQMALLHRFVAVRGGGLLMLGGAESFREGNYGGTPVAALLPVYLDRPTDATLTPMLQWTLTREGWLQPWTRLRPTEAEEQARLASMPLFEVLNPVREIKPGATELARGAMPAGQTCPALVVQRFGLGRSAALTVGDLWRWGLGDEAMQKDRSRAWRQLIRWLVSDVPPPIAIEVQAGADGNPAAVRLKVKVRDAEFNPLDGAAVRLRIQLVCLLTSPSAGATVVGTATNHIEITAEPSATEAGTYEATYIAREAGAYFVEARVVQADGTAAGSAVAGWTSDPAAEEFRSLNPNRALLETIARRTGGEIVAMNELDQFVRRLPARRAPITETWSEPLWHRPGVFLFVLACFVAEWGVRRWKGLP